MPSQPTVTVAVPARNEERNLGRALASIAAQTYGGILEVIVADGRSIDRTRTIASQAPNVRVIDNPARHQAAGLNQIIAAARGEIIVRVDAHCELPPDYVEQCVRALLETRAAMVGGSMVPVASESTARAVAAAMRSRLGAGPARFHVGGDAGWVDTVYLGAYFTKAARAVGGYDEDLLTNEDAELAIRLGVRGGVWFDPSISAYYTPRSSVPEVARQFYRYGIGRAGTLRRHPTSVKARQLAAPALVVGLLSPWRRHVGTAYLAVLLLGAVQARREGAGTAARVPAVLAAMHLSWGIGVLVGAVGSHRGARPEAQ
jgi:glycosyltransferase involved in cell wall biosynthesis